jgi:hypothetical protein
MLALQRHLIFTDAYQRRRKPPQHASRHHILVVKRRADDIADLHHDDLVLHNVIPQLGNALPSAPPEF